MGDLMNPVRLLCAAILALTGLVAVGLTTETANAASSKDLNVTYTKVIKNEKFSAYGRLATHNIRTVKLQYRDDVDDAWKTLSTQKSSSLGYFEFSPSTSRTRYFRYYVPAGGGDPKISGNSRKITVVSQKVTFFAVTPSFQCSNVNQENVTMFAHFYPVRPYRSVHFTTNVGTLQAYQDAKGNAAVTFYPGASVFTFAGKATTDQENSAAAKSSAPFTYRQSYCDL
jgi:hypothetical protein